MSKAKAKKSKQGRATPKGTKPSKHATGVGHAPRWLKKREMEAQGLSFGDAKPTGVRCTCGWSTITMGVSTAVVGVPPRRVGPTAREKVLEAYEEHVRAAPAKMLRHRGPVGLAAAPPLASKNSSATHCECGWEVPPGLSDREAQAAFEEHRNAEFAEVG